GVHRMALRGGANGDRGAARRQEPHQVIAARAAAVSAPHAAHAHDAVASAWVTRFASLVTAGGRVLDLACGRGRHARLFAARGCPVVAIDRDPAALAAIRDIEGVTPIVADLESAPWPTEMGRFDAIVVTNYLHRALFP